MDISRFKLFLKLLFGGVDSALMYLLDKFNDLMCREDVAKRVSQVVATAGYVMNFMQEWNEWCPEKWRRYWDAVYGSIDAVHGAFLDGKITPEEAANLKAAFQVAYATWRSED